MENTARNVAGSDSIVVLVVDDDAVNRLILEGMLLQSGFKVVTAENGLQALDLYAHYNPHVVLMDVIMPVMDGYTAANRIKQMAGNVFIPIIFLTAVTDDNELAKCVRCGGDDFMTKPFSRVILLAKIEALNRMAGLYRTITKQRDEIDRYNIQLLREQKVAKKIYSRLIDEGCLNIPVVRYILSPLSIFNGDLLLATRTPSGDLNIMLGDATGHGLPAAIGTVPVADIFYSLSETGASTEEIVLTLNQKLKNIFPPEFFLCASIVNFSKDFRLMTVWHGGLPDIIVYSGQQHKVTATLRSNNFPLGVVKNQDLSPQIKTFELQHGDRVLMYSDGVIEARNPEGEEFGRHRLDTVLSQGTDADVILDHINRAVRRFRGRRDQSDDVTILEVNANADLISEDNSGHYLESVTQHPGDWELRYHLTQDDFRQANPISVITRYIGNIKGLNLHREKIYVVLSELYNNALDHGVLRLSSTLKAQADGFTRFLTERHARLHDLQQGQIDIYLQHTTLALQSGRLFIKFHDSGEGFDILAQQALLTANTGFSGRGLALIKSLCKEFHYEDNGTTAVAVYQW